MCKNEFLPQSLKSVLSREGQSPTQLVNWLGQLQSVERGTQTQLDTWSQNLVVGDGSDTRVSNLGLDESRGVQNVLDSGLNTDGLTSSSVSLRVPGGLSTNLGNWRNLVVVSSREDGQVRGSGNRDVVDWLSETKSSGISGDLTGADVVTNLSTGGEVLVTEGGITDEGWTLNQVEERTCGDRWVVEDQVELGTLGSTWDQRGDNLSFETWGQSIGKLNLGVQSVGGVPALGQGQTSGLVSKLGLDVSSNGTILWRGLTLGGEGDTVWSNSGDLNGSWVSVVEVLVQETVLVLGDIRECWRSH